MDITEKEKEYRKYDESNNIIYYEESMEGSPCDWQTVIVNDYKSTITWYLNFINSEIII